MGEILEVSLAMLLQLVMLYCTVRLSSVSYWCSVRRGTICYVPTHLLQDNGEFPDEKTLLRSQNRRLAEEMRRRQRQEAQLEKELAKAWAKQGHLDATISIVKRAWDQVPLSVLDLSWLLLSLSAVRFRLKRCLLSSHLASRLLQTLHRGRKCLAHIRLNIVAL